MTLVSVNPATGEAIRAYPRTTPAEIEAALAAAEHAFRGWRETALAARAERLRAAATVLRRRREELARLAALEMGKPLAQGIAEVDKCAVACDHYADHGAELLADQPVASDAGRSYVAFRPLGVVLAVMPWNFPFWQVFRFAAPTLMAGNAVLLKHASNVPGCALAIAEVLREAELPEGLFAALLVGHEAVASLLADPRVRAATLTGSTPAGRDVAARAGGRLKKTVLELGGSDPYVVLADADLAPTVATCVTSRLNNSGQSCIAAKRFVVVAEVYDEFLTRLTAAMAAKRWGDPLAAGVDIGPLARHDLRDELHRQVRRSVEVGARLLLGGEVPASPGAFYPPTVLADVRRGMAAYEEELFGPVAAVLPAADDEEALAIANDTAFGLGAAVFSRDVERAERLARDRLEAGSCFVNALVRSDPRLPFGGVKDSGFGRELGDFGIHEFVNVKTVWVAG